MRCARRTARIACWITQAAAAHIRARADSTHALSTQQPPQTRRKCHSAAQARAHTPHACTQPCATLLPGAVSGCVARPITSGASRAGAAQRRRSSGGGVGHEHRRSAAAVQSRQRGRSSGCSSQHGYPQQAAAQADPLPHATEGRRRRTHNKRPALLSCNQSRTALGKAAWHRRSSSSWQPEQNGDRKKNRQTGTQTEQTAKPSASAARRKPSQQRKRNRRWEKVTRDTGKEAWGSGGVAAFPLWNPKRRARGPHAAAGRSLRAAQQAARGGPLASPVW